MLANHSLARWNPLPATWTQWLRRRPEPRQQEQPARPRAPVSINLIAAQRSQAIVDLRFQGLEGVFQSTIVAVDTESGSIRIDEWFPKGGPVQTGQRVTVSLRLGNRREQFTTHIKGRDSADGIERHTLHLPSTVGYEQRRGAYRLPLRGGQLRCDFLLAHFRYAAAVRDISALGMRLELREWRPLPVGSVLEDVTFELSGQHFNCAATVRHTRDSSDGGTEIGLMFIDLAPSGQRELERLIMRLQRRELRRSQAMFPSSASDA